jgi:hypothetical protein
MWGQTDKAVAFQAHKQMGEYRGRVDFTVRRLVLLQMLGMLVS